MAIEYARSKLPVELGCRFSLVHFVFFMFVLISTSGLSLLWQCVAIARTSSASIVVVSSPIVRKRFVFSFFMYGRRSQKGFRVFEGYEAYA